MRRLLPLIGIALALCVPSHDAFAAGTKSSKEQVKPRCNDRRDNDGDGLFDYPKDPGCRSKRDDSEYNSRRRRRATPTPTAVPVIPTAAFQPGETPLPTATPRVGTTPGQLPTATVTPVSGNVSEIPTGVGVSLKGHRPFPADNPWNTDISNAPVDPNSDRLIASIGLTNNLVPDFGTFWEGRPVGEQYTVVAGNEPRIPMTFQYANESDPGPYPIPLDAPVEGGADSTGDRHVIVIDRDNWVLYETWDSHPEGNRWRCGSGAVFDLNSNDLRPEGWTSADAAGLPLFPALVRYDEVVELGEINHALRFTAQNTRSAHIAPARHSASSSTDPNLPPLGMRVRLKASYDISGFSPRVQVILRALKRYGMFLADNGLNWYISGAHDTRWNDTEMRALRQVQGMNFEVVQMGTIIEDEVG